MDNTTIANVTVAGTVSNTGGDYTGGIAGRAINNSTLTNATATGTVDGVKATYKWNRPWPLKDKTYKGGGQNIGSIVGLTTGTSTIN
ncbi:MAG: GLUG motif-containing protein [Candidatus Nanopelagicales bacterium]